MCVWCTGLQNDCPFRPGANGKSHLSQEDAEAVDPADFEAYATRLNTYLQVRSLPIKKPTAMYQVVTSVHL